MNAADVEAALAEAGLTAQRRIQPKGGRLEALEVPGALAGFKAEIVFDEATQKVRTVIVRGDSVTIEAAQSERARLEARFGAPKETSFHRSRQWDTKAVEISGERPSWRVTQSLLRSGDAKTNVEWPSLSSLAWGMSVARTTAALKTAGFVPERAPKTKPSPAKRGAPKRPQKAQKVNKPILPPNAPRGAKLIELMFQKGEEHVLVALLDKTGLFKVSIGVDASDRKAAERRAAELAKGLGSALSEAETESSLWEDPIAVVRLSITGFQGQRIVFESYRNPKDDLVNVDD